MATQAARAEERRTMESVPGLIPDDEIFVRMTLQQRLQHILLVATFATLVVTGIPLLYPEWRIWTFLESFFWVRSLIHRIAGVGLIVASFWHVAYVMGTEEGGRYFREMLPKLVDARQMIQAFFHKLGLVDWLYRRGIARDFLDRNPELRFTQPPDYDKYNWIEKFEYLAVVWGNFVMILTGLCLWYFEAAFALLPKWGMDIVKLVHGFEALLAFLAIAIWHMYNVHLSPEVFPMSRLWLSGRITGAAMRHHHPAWYRRIEAERREQRRVEEALRLYREAYGDESRDGGRR